MLFALEDMFHYKIKTIRNIMGYISLRKQSDIYSIKKANHLVRPDFDFQGPVDLVELEALRENSLS